MVNPIATLWNITQELSFKKQRQQRELKRQQEIREIEQFLEQSPNVTPDDYALWIHKNRQQFIELLNKQVVSD
jgi:hypothetical protein